MTQTADQVTAAEPWRFFRTEVRRAYRLSPSFVRVTLAGDDLDRLADNGFDQRIKLVPPLPETGFSRRQRSSSELLDETSSKVK